MDFGSFISPLYLANKKGLFGSSGSSRTPGVPKGYERFETFDPQQKELFQGLLAQLGGGSAFGGPAGGALSYYQNLLQGGPEATAAFEAPYLRQFQEQTVPGLAERFAGMGAGAQSSSAFQQALGQAGAGLQENLAALRGNLQMQAAPQIMNLIQSLLGQSSFGLVQKEKPWWQSLLTSGAEGVGKGLGMAAGGAIF